MHFFCGRGWEPGAVSAVCGSRLAVLWGLHGPMSCEAVPAHSMLLAACLRGPNSCLISTPRIKNLDMEVQIFKISELPDTMGFCL